MVELTAGGGGRYLARVDGVEIALEAKDLGRGCLRLETPEGGLVAETAASGRRRFVRLGKLDFVIEREPEGRARGGATHAGGLEAPMPGVVTRVMVAAGEAVRKGQPLVALEAMKMEHLIRAPRAGRVKQVRASPGQMVGGGAALVEMEAE